MNMSIVVKQRNFVPFKLSDYTVLMRYILLLHYMLQMFFLIKYFNLKLPNVCCSFRPLHVSSRVYRHILFRTQACCSSYTVHTWNRYVVNVVVTNKVCFITKHDIINTFIVCVQYVFEKQFHACEYSFLL